MTSKAQITKRASADGVDARVVERDYVLAHIVALVSSYDRGASLVFKGGTSLRFLHFDEYRYSADLDYSVVQGSEADALEMIQHALAQQRPDTIKELSLERSSGRITFVGPLGTARMIKLDLAADELVVNTEKRSLLKRWPDVPDVSVEAYTKLEITAEKLRCLLQRLQCRDLVDLALLLGDEDPTSTAELFRRKAVHRGFDPAMLSERFERRVQDYKARWERELEEYLGEVPHFDEVERTVRRALRRAGLL